MDRRVLWAMLYMQRNLHRRLSVSRVARAVNLSCWHFSRLFRSEAGSSPGQYLKTVRIHRARELLEMSFLKVKEVGRHVGIRDGSHFVRDFQRVYGVSPSRYRLRLPPPEVNLTRKKIGRRPPLSDKMTARMANKQHKWPLDA